jgi:CDP-diacylglycerol--serine O-phosphatidyltransferase
MSSRHPGEPLSPADVVTILNAVLGFLAVAVLARNSGLHPRELSHGLQPGELKLAGALIGAGALCDVADGIVARATRTSRLGDHLDIMADTVTFGVAPALLVVVVGLGFPSPLDAVALVAASTHLVAVVVRLARHAAAPHAPSDGFVGVTSPIGAVGVILVIALDPGPASTLAGVFGLSALMLATFSYPHQTRRAVVPVLVSCVCCAVGALAGLVPLWLASVSGLSVIGLVPVATVLAARIPSLASTSRSLRAR